MNWGVVYTKSSFKSTLTLYCNRSLNWPYNLDILCINKEGMNIGYATLLMLILWFHSWKIWWIRYYLIVLNEITTWNGKLNMEASRWSPDWIRWDFYKEIKCLDSSCGVVALTIISYLISHLIWYDSTQHGSIRRLKGNYHFSFTAQKRDQGI